MVVKPNDVLLRRTRIGTLDQNLMEQYIPSVVDIFAKELKWDEERKQKEINESLQELERLRKIII
jgi:glycerol-3-phosphate dehydrogenase